MDKKSILGIVVLVLALGAYATYDYKLVNRSRAVSVLLDPTDGLIIADEREDILQILDVENDIGRSMDVRFGVITDLEVLYYDDVWLSSHWAMMEAKRFRDEEVETFQIDIDRTLLVLTAQQSKRDHSAIYRAINGEMQRLALQENSTKEIHIWSNLMENTEQLSVLSHEKNPLTFDPLVFADQLRSVEREAPSHKVQLVVHHDPQTRNESILFTRIVEAYKLVYPNAHIEISTQ